jgi:hypothetical protein
MSAVMPAKKQGGCCSGKKKPADSSEVPVLEPLPTQEITPINKVEEQGGCQCCSSNRTEADPVDGIPLLHPPQLTCSHRRWSSSTGGHQFPLCMWHLPRMLLGNMLPGLQVSRNVTKTRRGTHFFPEHGSFPDTQRVARACFQYSSFAGGVLAFSEIHTLWG